MTDDSFERQIVKETMTLNSKLKKMKVLKAGRCDSEHRTKKGMVDPNA